MTLAKNGIAQFPDAPTKRGVKHIQELVQAVEIGYKATILFIIQRSDCHRFSPNDDLDPDFSKALRFASKKRVQILAYDTQVLENEIFLDKPIAVEL